MDPKLEHFLICDEATQDELGLLDIKGLVPASLHLSGPGSLPRLTCVLVLSRMAGIQMFRPTVDVIYAGPGPKPGRYRKVHDWQSRPAESDVQVYAPVFQPFHVTASGTYVFRIAMQFDPGGGSRGFTHLLKVICA